MPSQIPNDVKTLKTLIKIETKNLKTLTKNFFQLKMDLRGVYQKSKST